MELHNRLSITQCERGVRNSEEGRAAALRMKNKRASDTGSTVEGLLDLWMWQLQINTLNSRVPEDPRLE